MLLIWFVHRPVRYYVVGFPPNVVETCVNRGLHIGERFCNKCADWRCKEFTCSPCGSNYELGTQWQEVGDTFVDVAAALYYNGIIFWLVAVRAALTILDNLFPVYLDVRGQVIFWISAVIGLAGFLKVAKLEFEALYSITLLITFLSWSLSIIGPSDGRRPVWLLFKIAMVFSVICVSFVYTSTLIPTIVVFFPFSRIYYFLKVEKYKPDLRSTVYTVDTVDSLSFDSTGAYMNIRHLGDLIKVRIPHTVASYYNRRDVENMTKPVADTYGFSPTGLVPEAFAQREFLGLPEVVREALQKNSAFYPDQTTPGIVFLLKEDQVVGVGSRVDLNGRDVLLTATHVLRELAKEPEKSYVGTTLTKLHLDSEWPAIFCSSESDLDLTVLLLPPAVWSSLGVKKLKSTTRVSSSDYVKVVGMKRSDRVHSKGTMIPWKSRPFYYYHAASTIPSFSGTPMLGRDNLVKGVHLGRIGGKNYGVSIKSLTDIFGYQREVTSSSEEDSAIWKRTDFEASDWKNKYEFKLGKRSGCYLYDNSNYHLDDVDLFEGDDHEVIVGWNTTVSDVMWTDKTHDLTDDWVLEDEAPQDFHRGGVSTLGGPLAPSQQTSLDYLLRLFPSKPGSLTSISRELDGTPKSTGKSTPLPASQTLPARRILRRAVSVPCLGSTRGKMGLPRKELDLGRLASQKSSSTLEMGKVKHPPLRRRNSFSLS